MTPTRHLGTAALASALTLASIAAPGADERATPEEVIERVRQAAAHLAETGEAGLDAFRAADSEFVWKDTYVVVGSCELDRIVVHPIRPDLEGMPLSVLTDGIGAVFGPDLCRAVEGPEGGWVEYLWPRPGEAHPSRKLTYSLNVEGTPYHVSAGVYDQDLTVEELDRLGDGR